MTVTQVSNKVSEKDIEEYRGQLLDWYDQHERHVPWRIPAGETSDPYRVWLSEIMCQQTTVQAVIPYYTKFLEIWPKVEDLASAKQEEVMAQWAGLGYYARARNLHKCAQVVANDLNGEFPDTQEALKELPGIGDYTSAAIAAIAYGRETVVVDGNVERVIARFYAVEEALPKAKSTLKTLAAEFYEGLGNECGHLAQAFMDLGANVCIPKAPRCMLCPIADGCTARKRGQQTDFPVKAAKKARPQRFGKVYFIDNDNNEMLFHRREEKGLLGGMVGLPTTEWGAKDTLNTPNAIKSVKSLKLNVYHVFTHFDLELELCKGTLTEAEPPEGYFWADPYNELENLPTAFKKALKSYLNA
ncbi:MAG: A/G-specific adenine glycosylase [Alphaproteobacteria bacterium]|nr:A/G-specific adenine glycosylase [Alphaproteobacteria bacterium]